MTEAAETTWSSTTRAPGHAPSAMPAEAKRSHGAESSRADTEERARRSATPASGYSVSPTCEADEHSTCASAAYRQRELLRTSRLPPHRQARGGRAAVRHLARASRPDCDVPEFIASDLRR